MTIPSDDITAARSAWGNGLILISQSFEADGIDAARSKAKDILDTLYGYEFGPVLFKPTLSGGAQTFRTTIDGALSYFVGHSAEFPQDNGFGIMGWQDVRSETAAEFVDGDVAIWMGWVFCTDRDGQVTKVDKTFGYKKDSAGALRIVLHHSSLPYVPST